MKMHLFLFSILFFSCAEKDPAPTLEQQIQGVWRGIDYPENWIGFQDGEAWNAKIAFGQTVYENRYVYTTLGDTLKMLDIEQFERRVFVVSFPNDTVAQFSTPGGLVFKMVRVK